MTSEVRQVIASAKRVVVKVGSSSLASSTVGLDPARLDAIADALAARVSGGSQVVLVSSGAIAAGLRPLGLATRPRDLATQQAAASVGQGMLVAHYTQAFARHGLTVGQVLLTADDVVRRAHYRNAARTFERLLGLGVVPVVNENDTVATEEIRFGDNDRIAALVTHLVGADALVLLSDVDGVYDADPANGPATRISDVRSDADLAHVQLGAIGRAGVGSGGMATKVAAAKIAAGAGVPTLLASAQDAAQALSGGDVGTCFHPTGKRAPARLLWLAHATTGRGSIRLDAGAVAAVVERRSSLLPAGITAVEGEFAAGDPVDLLDDGGRVVARGLTAYDSAELPGLLGRSTHELVEALGPSYSREVVHRDDLALL
ncbi:MAG TPA: glutamate 5-kinase [Mycobacteriales bacterium]|nr:glutamate 5-kinase [Mycobacteriales bacterium]HWB67994.1 glutamate 5-kinase [Mycobacteriales bacterium]